MSNLNIVMRHKARDQSQFRVHFYIKYVYFDSELQPDQFLEAITLRLVKIVPLAHLQIASPIKRFIDLSVGLQSDQAAFNFIQSGRRILLPGETGTAFEHEIVVSEAFKTYYKAMRDGKMGENEKEVVKDSYKSEKQSSSSPFDRKKQRETAWKRKYDDRKRQEDDVRINFLWIFCIPFECKEREVCATILEKGMRVKSCEWKLKEDMEYLQVQLTESISLKDLESLDCRIDKYPILVLPRLQDQHNVYQHILKHEVELTFEKDIDEIEFIKFVDKIGGVLALIKDEYYGPRKYVIAFNSSTKIDILIEQVGRKYKNSHCERPKYALRLGRVEKNFTFTQIVENLMACQEQM